VGVGDDGDDFVEEDDFCFLCWVVVFGVF